MPIIVSPIDDISMIELLTSLRLNLESYAFMFMEKLLESHLMEETYSI